MNREQAIPINTFNKRVSRRMFFRGVKETVVGDVRSIPRTIIEASAVAVFNASLNSLGYGRVPIRESMNQDFRVCERGLVEDLWEDSIKVPIYEELTSRLLPGVLFGKSLGVGALTSLVFAYEHGQLSKSYENQTASIKLRVNPFPLNHFIMGAFFWKVFKERGFLNAVVAHSTNNIIATIAQASTCDRVDIK